MIDPTKLNWMFGAISVLCLIIAGVYWILAGGAETVGESEKEDKYIKVTRISLIVGVGVGVIVLIRLFFSANS